MNITSTIKSWARDNNFRVTRFNQDHSLDSRYPDSVPTVHLEATLETGAKGCPHLRIWIPLARRTPLFAFGPDAAKPEETDVDATFPSFTLERNSFPHSVGSHNVHADLTRRVSTEHRAILAKNGFYSATGGC